MQFVVENHVKKFLLSSVRKVSFGLMDGLYALAAYVSRQKSGGKIQTSRNFLHDPVGESKQCGVTEWSFGRRSIGRVKEEEFTNGPRW